MTEAAPATGPAGTMRPRRTPVADLFEETFRLYGRNFLVMALSYAAFAIPILLANVALLVLQADWYRQPLLSPSQQAARFLENLVPFASLAVLFLLVAIVLGTFGAAAITYVAGRARSGDAASLSEVAEALRRLAPSILGLSALAIVGGILLLIGLPTVALASTALSAAVFGGRAVPLLGALIFLVALILSFVVVARLALAIPVLVLERRPPWQAIQRTWKLVEGSTWRTFGIFLLGVFVISVVAGFATPFYIPVLFEGLFTGSAGSLVLTALFSGVIQALLGPILPTLLTVLYFDYVAYRPEA